MAGWIQWDFVKGAWTRELAWWYGALLGDGNVYRNVSRGDYRVSISGAPSTVARWLKLIDPMREPKRIREGVNAVQGYVNSKELVAVMEERWGLCGPKSANLPWPEDLPAEFFVDFARGLWDTDGSLFVEIRRHRRAHGNNTPRASYSTMDPAFAERFRTALATNAGVRVTAVTREQNKIGVWYTFKYGGSTAMKVADYLYGNAPAHLVNDDRVEAYSRLREATAVAEGLCPCGEPARDEGLCKACWWEQRRQRGETKAGVGTVCVTEGCSKEVLAKGMCSACYTRARRGPKKVKVVVPCRTGGCDKPTRARGLCSTCYVREKRREKKRNADLQRADEVATRVTQRP